MIAKSCPKCELQVAVASKSCKCGYSFFSARRITRGATPEKEVRRRTGRVRREKPNFYDSQEYEKKKKRRRRSKQLTDAEEKDVKKEPGGVRGKRRQRRKEEDDGGGDLVAKLTEEKQELASLILSEINRKLGVVNWRPAQN